MWLDGIPYWKAMQMDAMSLPILLADKLHRQNALDGYNPAPMMHRAAQFLLHNGPVTEQDRWETTPGYSPYTMATQVAALLAAADSADLMERPRHAAFLRDTADAWNDSIDEFTYVEGTPLTKKHGVSGYYVRITPPKRVEEVATGDLQILMPNNAGQGNYRKAVDIVSPDALALVRFGLRAANDPKIVDTLKIIDATLKYNTSTGPTYTRLTDDGYGENDDGSPFKKTGVGRGWPLLAGERAHYELACGNGALALELLKTMTRQTSECGMIPEQVWNAPDIPKHFLFNGRPAGSSMPLVWAHSEYIKLLRSLHDGRVWDMPPQPVERYLKQRRIAAFQIWTAKQQRGWVTQGKNLRIDLTVPSTVHWKAEGESGEVETNEPVFRLHCALLTTSGLADKAKIRIKISPQNGDGRESSKPVSFSVMVHSVD
ncbi:MAG: glycoside hydrolase family 15 protein [Bryobacteraceae bacterium]